MIRTHIESSRYLIGLICFLMNLIAVVISSLIEYII